jgi:membrane-associated phospholipid phosphatase
VDAWVPFLPAAVWLYASWYVAPALIFFAERSQFRRTALAVAAAFLACAVGWTLVPAVMTRPVLDGRPDASARMLRAIYAIDPPSNLFPSFHAALAAIIAWAALAWPRAFPAVLAWMVAICASCLLTRQHYVLDVVAGVLVGLGAVAAVQAGVRYIARRREGRDPRVSHQTSPVPSATARPVATGTSELDPSSLG